MHTERTKKPERAASAAPHELNRLEVLRGLRLSTWDGSLATVWSSLTTGAFLTGFALWLGADSVAIGLLTAIPTLAGLVQIVSSYSGERHSSRRTFTALYSLIGRMLWLPILLLPILLPRPLALTGFLILFALSSALVNVPVPAWTSWMSDLVPPGHRGRYFGQRNMVAGIVGMLVGLPAAWFLDVATKRHHWESLGFGVLFGVGVAGGIASVVCLLRQPEPTKRPLTTGTTSSGLAGLLSYYRSPFADPNFRRLMLFNMVFSAGQNIAAPFFTVYALQNLRLNYVWLQILATVTSVASLASMPLWGYLTDKFGNKPLIAIGILGVFSLPLSWVLTAPGHDVANAFLLTEISVGSGMFWAVVGLAQFNLLIGFSPPDRTPVYAATMAAVTGLTGGLAPLFGGVVVTALAGWSFHLPGLTLINLHVVFILSALLRLSGLLFLRPIVDTQARSTRDVLRQLGQANPRDWRNIRRLQRAGDAGVRLRATEELAGSRAHLASGELQTALMDPSLEVREEAARALGEIGDRAAVEALLAALRDPAAGLIDEAALALGRIGDRRANSALAAILNSDSDALSRRDRLAVAQALGDLGGSDAVDALLAALQRARDEQMAETLVASLGRIGSARATPALVALLQRPETARGVRLALVRALGEIGDREGRDALRAELDRAGDDTVLLPLLADALSRLCDETAAPPLLHRLVGLASPVARKQVAHAIGVLIGQGESVYSLLALDELTRDPAVARLAHDLLRHLKASPAAGALREALELYTAGDYADCLRALKRAGDEIAPVSGSEGGPLSACRALLEQAAEDTGPVPVEVVLLAFCALRSLVLAE